MSPLHITKRKRGDVISFQPWFNRWSSSPYGGEKFSPNLADIIIRPPVFFFGKVFSFVKENLKIFQNVAKHLQYPAATQAKCHFASANTRKHRKHNDHIHSVRHGEWEGLAMGKMGEWFRITGVFYLEKNCPVVTGEQVPKFTQISNIIERNCAQQHAVHMSSLNVFATSKHSRLEVHSKSCAKPPEAKFFGRLSRIWAILWSYFSSNPSNINLKSLNGTSPYKIYKPFWILFGGRLP